MRALRRDQRLIAETLVLGVVGALSAQAFTHLVQLCQGAFLGLLAGYTPPGLPNEGGVLVELVGARGLWLIPLATTLGGLLSGFLVYTFAPEAEGHGTDAVVKAYHHAAGFIRARVAPLKLVASAITIGSGGAAGREGPTALITAGFGSVYGGITRRTDEERRLLVLIGMAAGLSAMFRSPIGAAIFAIEVLYSEMDFEAGALIYTMLAAVVAYAVNGLFVGWQPLFSVPADLSVPTIGEHLFFVVLGVASGLVATLLVLVFYGTRAAFRALPVPSLVKPAIGGLGVGVMALFLPQVLGGGYGWVQEAIDGRLAVGVLLLLLAAKIVALSLTISSGGSGGVFAPTLFVGAMLGGALAAIFGLPPASFVIVGMAAVFGGGGRVPIATMLMVTEMTGGYQLLPAAAVAVTLSHVVQATLSGFVPHGTLYEAQVPRRRDSPAHHAEHLEAALRLMGESRSAPASEIGRVALRTLLRSGIAVDLEDGKELAVGVVEPSSPFLGKPIGPGGVLPDDGTMRLLAIAREGRLLTPGADVVLATGDELLAIVAHEELGSWRKLLGLVPS